jgi:SagB-type dehydrogenase family enzyme
MKVIAPGNIRGRSPATDTNDWSTPGRFRPRFLHELVVVPFNDEVIIEGTERLQAIKDTTENNILLDLIGLMDGDRTLDQLKSALPGTSEEDVLETISSLSQFGLVEDGAATSETAYSNTDTLGFLRRHVAVIGANRSGAQAYKRLVNSEVLIFDSDDDSSHGECLRNLLATTGIGRVVPLKRALPPVWRPSISATQSIAISLSFRGEDRGWHEELDDWCFKHELPWLRLVLSKNNNYVDFGPLFNAERIPCYRCVQEVHSIPHDSGGELDESEREIETSYWTGIAAIEIIYFLSRIAPLTTERTIERYDLRRHTSRRLPLLRVPGCLRCRPLAQEQLNSTSNGHTINSAVAFEDYIAISARPRTPSVVQEDYAQLSSVLITQIKRMPNSTPVLLPPSLSRLERSALEILGEPINAHSHVITVDDLSTLLMVTAGIRESDEQKVQRWTATAGNLGSVELFVIVHRVGGLQPGIYFYQPEDHSLASFQQRGETPAIADLMQRVAVIDSTQPPDVLVVFTGAYHRLERKYGEFGYKLVNLDAGVAVSQFHFVAKSLGLISLTALRWADDLIERQLNLEQRREQVTAVAALYATTSTPPPAVHSTDDSIAGAWHLTNRPSDFCELELHEIGERLYWESRIDEHKLHSSAPKCSSAGREVMRGPSLPLPPPENSGGPTAKDILTQRTTVREFSDDQVSPSELATMLYYAHREDQQQWSEQHFAHPLTFYVLAWNLTGFEPAVYAYDAEKHGLQFVAPARSYQESMDLFVQPEFASAAVVIWIAGDLAAACAGLGPLGHRYLLLRAGSAGNRLWTAALAMGLSGGVTAGVLSGVAREHFGLDGYHQVSLLAYATGVEAEDVEETVLDGESE